MVLTVKASVIPIDELEQQFGLVEVEDTQFFQEWQDNLPELTQSEQDTLDRIKKRVTERSRGKPRCSLFPLVHSSDLTKTPKPKSQLLFLDEHLLIFTLISYLSSAGGTKGTTATA